MPISPVATHTVVSTNCGAASKFEIAETSILNYPGTKLASLAATERRARLYRS